MYSELNRYGLTGYGVNVAVLDTGIAPHPDFDNRIILFRDFVRGKNRPYDDNGHGTHVAGIIGGSGGLSQGRFQGIAPACGIAALKVLDRRGNGSLKCVLSGIRWLLDHYQEYGIRIVNISVGAIPRESGQSSVLIRSVEQLWEEGLIVTAAAGNRGPGKGSVTTPGISRKVITVGCSDDYKEVEVMGNRMVDYSGRGPTMACISKPDLVAPGSGIISCCNQPGQYMPKSGTSMSTPLVSGAVALLLERYPQMTNRDVKLRLIERAVDMGRPHNQQGWGLLDVGRLLLE